MATAPPFPRIVIDHARYWRGQPHVWSTNYYFGGDAWSDGEAATVANALMAAESAALFNPGAGQGGFTEVRGYNAVLGAPVYTNVIGLISNPASWGAYSGSAWSGISNLSYNTVAEAALYLDTPLAGLSVTGKPVKSTKFFHSVGNVVGAGAAGDEVPAAVITAINSAFTILNSGIGPNARRMISPGGRFPSGAPTVRPYIGNHQMPQGRRKSKAAANLSFTARLIRSIEDNPELALLADL